MRVALRWYAGLWRQLVLGPSGPQRSATGRGWVWRRDSLWAAVWLVAVHHLAAAGLLLTAATVLALLGLAEVSPG